MPSNYSDVLQTQEPVDVGSKYEVDTTTEANLIGRAGKSISDLFEGMKQGQNKDALGEISGEIADIESGVVSYNEALADIRQRTASGDATIREQAQQEFEAMKQGRMQGKISPSMARLRTNAVIKKFSVAYPHLSKDIRSMANESMDNYAAIEREIFGNDPVNKAVNDVISQAVELGTTPDVVVHYNNAKKVAETDLLTQQVRIGAGRENRETAIQSVQVQSYENSKVDTYNLLTELNKRIRAGETITVPMIENMLGRAKDEYTRKYVGQVLGVPGVTQEDIKNALGPAMEMFDNVGKIMKSQGGTVEEQVNLAKLIQEGSAAQAANKLSYIRNRLPSVIAALPDGQLFQVLQAAARVYSRKDDIGINAEVWDRVADTASGTGDVTVASGLMLVRTEEGQALIGELVGDMLAGNQIREVNTVLSTSAKRDAADIVADIPQPLIRKEYAAKIINSFTWKDIAGNPAIAKEAAQDPAMRDDAMGKAAAYSSDIIFEGGVDVGDIVVDHTNFAEPFKLKTKPVQTRRGGNAEGVEIDYMAKLNAQYHTIINTFGAAGIDLWLQKTGLDAAPKDTRNPDGTPKKKVTNKQSSTNNPVMDTILGINEENFKLPSALVEAFAGQESDSGRNYGKDAGAGARGPLQITEGTFKNINDKFFGGALSFDKEKDQITASLAYLRYLHNRHKGNVANMAMEYYSGTTNPNRRPKKGVPGPSAGEYASEVVQRYNANLRS